MNNLGKVKMWDNMRENAQQYLVYSNHSEFQMDLDLSKTFIDLVPENYWYSFAIYGTDQKIINNLYLIFNPAFV